MNILKFHSEGDYRIAQSKMIEMHEKNPPAYTVPVYAMAVTNKETPELITELVSKGISFEIEKVYEPLG